MKANIITLLFINFILSLKDKVFPKLSLFLFHIFQFKIQTPL